MRLEYIKKGGKLLGQRVECIIPEHINVYGVKKYGGYGNNFRKTKQKSRQNSPFDGCPEILPCIFSIIYAFVYSSISKNKLKVKILYKKFNKRLDKCRRLVYDRGEKQ